MIYIDKFGVLKTVDDSEYFSDDISEQTIEIVDDWKIMPWVTNFFTHIQNYIVELLNTQ